MTSDYTFIYDGECPFCNHFAELLEIKSKINNIKILDGRKNLTLIKSLLEKGYDLDKGAILLKDEDIFHGADAINTICKQINNPSSSLLLLLSRVFKSNKRTNLIFPLLVRARRLALISKGISFDINANLLALTSKGNITFVRLFDLNTLESNKSKLLEGLFICLQIVLIASAP